MIRLSREELSGSFPLASESGLSDLFDMLDTFLSKQRRHISACYFLISLTETINSRQLGKTLGRRIDGQTHASCHGTGHGFAPHMPVAYSRIVRSLENLPEPAIFKIALRAQSSGRV